MVIAVNHGVVVRSWSVSPSAATWRSGMQERDIELEIGRLSSRSGDLIQFTPWRRLFFEMLDPADIASGIAGKEWIVPDVDLVRFRAFWKRLLDKDRLYSSRGRLVPFQRADED